MRLFSETPFLNGGLFDCLDKEDDNGKVIYIDGFSRNSNKKAIIPDFLFFQKQEKKVDLSKYGLRKDSVVRGLIKILQSYNFTIDENTLIDQEVALDPELLGKVFENLLASYNPETSSTARKATGSYYTPREIVDYMVEASLLEYLKGKLPEIEEEKIKMLLSYSEEIPEFLEEEKQKIISAIDEIKILDPACGSGAFPMGALHMMVHILQKLDPNNLDWQKFQRNKVLAETQKIFQEQNKDNREIRLKELNDTFDESINYPDYARKLFLIENCIYGVDIQTIAIQISKLRFFISLVIDQKVDETRDNLGIRALPNMETRFVSANTLIGLEKPDNLFYTQEIKDLENDLKQLRHKYFSAKTRQEKLTYQHKDKELRYKLSNALNQIGYNTESSEKIAKFDIYDPNASADWFDPEWMFGVTDGFDIVIGNPPYGIPINSTEKEYYKKNYYVTKSIKGIQKGTMDSYALFIELGFKLLKKEGILIYIVPISITSSESNTGVHKLLEENCKEIKISSYAVRPQPIFENAVVDTSILELKKTLTPCEKILCTKMYRKKEGTDMNILMSNLKFIDVKNYKLYGRYPKISDDIEKNILEKLFSIKTKISDLISENGNPIYYRFAGGRYFKIFTNYPTGSTAENVLYFEHKIANSIGAILSSDLFFWYYQIYSDNHNLKQYDLKSFPIPIDKLSNNIIYNLENLYKKYLDEIEKNSKKINSETYSNSKSFKQYEIKKSKKIIEEIDDIVCPLYGLNDEETNYIKNYEIEFRIGNNDY